jgi:chemotaxis signal transduction protein
MRTLLFEHRGERFGLDVARLVEVLPAVRWRALGGLPAFAPGVFARHGKLLPLVDASILLGGEPTSLRVGSRIAVVPLAEGEGAPLGGILLESTLGLEEIDFAAADAFVGTAGARGPVARHAGGSVQLVRPDRLLDREQLARILGEAA